MKTISLSEIRDLIRDNSFRYFNADLVKPYTSFQVGLPKFIFSIGRFNEFSGYVAEYQTRPISFGTKTLLVALARCHGLIGCNF